MAVPTFFKKFADDNLMRISLDECGDYICKGKFGDFYIWDEGKQLIGVLLMGKSTAYAKLELLKQCSATGGKCDIEGDFEAIFVCTVKDTAFINNAKKLLKVGRKYIAGQEQIDRLMNMTMESRFKKGQKPVPAGASLMETA